MDCVAFVELGPLMQKYSPKHTINAVMYVCLRLYLQNQMPLMVEQFMHLLSASIFIARSTAVKRIWCP